MVPQKIQYWPKLGSVSKYRPPKSGNSHVAVFSVQCSNIVFHRNAKILLVKFRHTIGMKYGSTALLHVVIIKGGSAELPKCRFYYGPGPGTFPSNYFSL